MSFDSGIVETYCHGAKVLMKKTRSFLETKKEITFSKITFSELTFQENGEYWYLVQWNMC